VNQNLSVVGREVSVSEFFTKIRIINGLSGKLNAVNSKPQSTLRECTQRAAELNAILRLVPAIVS